MKLSNKHDEIEEKFVRRLKKGSGKYQGKFPFKCFNCGNIGHFASKCPHKKKDQNSEGEGKYKSKRFGKKKSLCVNNDDSSEDIDSDSSCEDKVNDFVLMAKEDYDNEIIGSDVNNEEVVVDLEGELISALEEIDRLRLKKRKQKQLLMQFEKNGKEPSEDFVLLKVELVEAKKIEDILKQQLSEKKARCEALEEEVVKTRKELEKFQALYHQNLSSIKASEGLATILNQQRNPKLKTGLGYEEGSSSGQPSNKESIKFVKSTTNDNNKPAETKEDNQPPRRSKEKGARTESVDQRNNTPSAQGNHQHGRNRPAQRRQPFSRYKDFFYGYCFYCSNFGHKAVNCSLRFRHEQSRHPRNKYLPQQRMRQPSNKQPQIANCQIKFRDMQLRRSRNNKQSMSRQCCNNHFDLLNNELECYNCHNFGHKAANFHLKNYKADPRIKLFARNASTWKKKDSEKCGLVLSTQKQKDSWNIDSGCSKHMTGDKDKILSISKSKTRNVTFEEDCKVKNVNSGQVVAKGIRTDNDVDIESSHARKEEVEEESCHKMEAEVVNLRKKVEKSNTQIKFLNSSMILDEILDSQRSPNDKSGLGYNKEEISTPKKPFVKGDASPSFVKRESRYDSGSSCSKNERNTTIFRRSDQEGHPEATQTPQSKFRRETPSWMNQRRYESVCNGYYFSL
jgi:hypothetical protein